MDLITIHRSDGTLKLSQLSTLKAESLWYEILVTRRIENRKNPKRLNLKEAKGLCPVGVDEH